MWTRHIYLLRLSRLAKGRESGGVRQPDGLAVRVLGDGAVEHRDDRLARICPLARVIEAKVAREFKLRRAKPTASGDR